MARILIAGATPGRARECPGRSAIGLHIAGPWLIASASRGWDAGKVWDKMLARYGEGADEV